MKKGRPYLWLALLKATKLLEPQGTRYPSNVAHHLLSTGNLGRISQEQFTR